MSSIETTTDGLSNASTINHMGLLVLLKAKGHENVPNMSHNNEPRLVKRKRQEESPERTSLAPASVSVYLYLPTCPWTWPQS